MAVRYRHEFTSKVEAIEWKIDIEDTDWVGAVAVETDYFESGFKLSYKGEVEERNQPFKPSQATINFKVNDATDLTFVQQLKAADEKRFSCLIYKGGNLYWFGHFIPDNIDWEDAPYPFMVNLTAIDYLGRLKEIPYDNAGTLYTGRDTLITHFIKILTKTGLDEFFTVSVTPFLRVSIDWWDTNHPARAQATDPAAKTDIAHEVFYKTDDNGDNIANNCYDVLDAILRQFLCRIWVGNGVFNICQLNEYVSSPFFTRIYDKEGNKLSDEASDYRKTVDQSNIFRLATGVNTFYEAIQKAQITYNHKAGKNLLSNSTSFNPAESIGSLVSTGGNKLLFTGEIIDETTGTDFFRVPVYEIDIVLTGVSTYQLLGAYGNTTNINVSWTTTASDVITIKGHGAFQVGTSAIPISFITPDIVEAATATFRFRFVEFLDNNGNTQSLPGGNTHTVTASNFQLKFLSGGEDEEKQVFTVTNTSDGTTPIVAPTIYEFPDTIIGDGPTGVNLGKLKVYDAAWVDSTAWNEGADTRNLNIQKLLLQEFIGTQRKPTEILQAEIMGDFDFRSRLTYNSIVWICGGATLDPKMDVWSGEWFEVARVVTNLVQTSDDIQEDFSGLITGGYNFAESGNSAYRFATDSATKAITKTTAVISSGSRTSFGVTAIGHTGLDVGDRIMIVNPYAFGTDTVTVDAYVSTAEVTITIQSHSFAADVPIGAYVIFQGNYVMKAIMEGSRNPSVQSKSAGYTMTPNDKFIQVDASGRSVDITLFSASGRNNLINVSAKDISYAVRVLPDGAETINGDSDYTFSEAYESIWLKADGSNWIIV